MRRLSFVLAIFGTIFFTGCALNQMVKMAKDQDLKVTPNPLELHGNTADFEVSATLPVKMLKKDLVYAIDARYEYEGQSYDLDRVEFVANDFPDRDTNQPRMTKEYSMPYSPGMEEGNLVVQGFAIDPRKNKEKEATPPLPIAPGLITTPWLVQPAYYSAYVSYDYKDDQVEGWTPNEELEPVNVNFYFPQGISQLRPSFKIEGEETNREKQSFLSAFIAEKNVTRTVTITGSHSPEGAERVNTNLAKDRPDRVEKYYRDMMDRYDYKGMAESIRFIIKPIIRSYDEFKKMLNSYDKMSAAEKQEILNIINGSGTFEDKEDALHKLSTYKRIFNDIYPNLRYAKTEILKVKEKKTDAEIAVLAKMIVEGRAPADTLIYGEMAYAAHLTPSLSEKEAIYKVATKQYPHFASHNNLGAVYLAMAIEDAKAGRDATSNLEKAVTQFEISIRNRDANAWAHGNLGVAYMMQGKIEQGNSEITKAIGMNPPVKHAQGFNSVKGVIDIKKGMYDDAIRSLSGVEETPVNLFNRGLAYLLKQEYDAASNNFEDATDKESDFAIAYYGNAIAAARKGDASNMATSLKQAVSADPALKAKAMKDLEFVKYVDTDSFRNALQ
jgi:tetratricopeptide (TPR) repeat protein